MRFAEVLTYHESRIRLQATEAKAGACCLVTSDSPPGRVYDVDHASLYRHVLGWHDEGRNDGAVWRVFVFFYHQKIPVGYVGPDHGLPHDPQKVAPPAQAGSHELRRKRVGLIPDRHGLEPASGSDPTQQRHLARSLPTLLCQPDAPRPPTLPLDIPGLLQLFEVLVRGLGTPQAHGLPHLAYARRPLSPHVRPGQAPEHLHPYLPVLRNHPRLL